MFLKLLNTKNNNKNVYSVGIVESKITQNTFKIVFENTSVQIFTKERLEKGEWIRFIGQEDEGVIFCEFVEVLRNVDVTLLIRSIKLLNEDI